MAAEQLRVGIAGTGFIGAVHARSARLAGARVVGGRRLVARERREGRGRRVRAPSGPSASAEELVAGPGRRRRAHLHAQPPPPAAGRGGARGRQARGLREAARHWTAAGADGAGRGRGAHRAATRRCRSSTASTRRCARRASACAAASRRGAPVHGTYLQDWLLRPERRQLARRPGARRRVARLRRHRLALVRPGRVRDRPPASPGCRRADHDGARAPRGADAARVRAAATAAASRGR